MKIVKFPFEGGWEAKTPKSSTSPRNPPHTPNKIRASLSVFRSGESRN